MNGQSSISVLVAVIILAIVLIVKRRKSQRTHRHREQRIEGKTEFEMKDLMADKQNEASMDIENAGSISGSSSTTDQDFKIEQEHVRHSETSPMKTAEDSLPQCPSHTQNTHVLQSEMVTVHSAGDTYSVACPDPHSSASLPPSGLSDPSGSAGCVSCAANQGHRAQSRSRDVSTSTDSTLLSSSNHSKDSQCSSGNVSNVSSPPYNHYGTFPHQPPQPQGSLQPHSRSKNNSAFPGTNYPDLSLLGQTSRASEIMPNSHMNTHEDSVESSESDSSETELKKAYITETIAVKEEGYNPHIQGDFCPSLNTFIPRGVPETGRPEHRGPNWNWTLSLGCISLYLAKVLSGSIPVLHCDLITHKWLGWMLCHH